MKPGAGTGRIPTLDGWRAVAILWVVLHHTQDAVFGPTGLFPSRALLAIGNAGPRGVDIFFGISGFLICSRLLDERREKGHISLRGFYLRRTFRILPPLFVYIGLVATLAAKGWLDVGWRPILAALTFWRNYLPEWMAANEHPVAHTWSLSIEEHFYIFWPITLILLATRRRAAWAALGLGLAVAVWRFVVLRANPTASIWRTDLRLDGLLFGAWIALVVDDPVWRVRLTRWISPVVWLGLACAFTTVAFALVPVPMPQFWIALIIPFLLIGTAFRPESIAGRVLEWGPLQWIGRLSYSIYIWQQLFLIRPEDRRIFGVFQTFPLSWLAVLACAFTSYHLIERPAIALGRQILARKKERSGSVPSRLHPANLAMMFGRRLS
jgi:peptidoglycan/LPS O-acetylase OafA/YrhL